MGKRVRKRRKVREEERKVEGGLKVKTLPEILGEIRRRTREVRAKARELILTAKRERQKMTVDVRGKIRKRVAELRSVSRQLIATSRHWRTGRP